MPPSIRKTIAAAFVVFLISIGELGRRYGRLGRSQFGEDYGLLRRYFTGVRNGSFLEMGALDGEKYSNSWYFEKQLNWRGVLIEGSPLNFAQIAKKRPDAIRVNAMVCTEARTLHWVEGKSSATSGAWELMSDAFRRRYHAGITDGMVKSFPTVECVHLNDILRRYGIRHVDLFSLDVEGAELSVLKAIDFDKFSASVILVEIRAGSPNLKPILTKAGYVQDDNLGPNAVFLHPQFKKSINRRLKS